MDAHPIIGGILNKLAFFRTHAAAVWYDKIAGQNVKDKFDEIDQDVNNIDAKMERVVTNITIPFISTGNDTIAIYKSGTMITVRNIYLGVRSSNPTIITLSGKEYLIIAKADNNNYFNLQPNGVFTLLYGYAINTLNQIVKLYTFVAGYDGTHTYLLTQQGLVTDQRLVIIPISTSIGYST